MKKKYVVDDKEKSSIANTTASLKSQMEPIKRLNEYTSNPSTHQQLHPVFRRKGFQAEAVKPVNFKFFECSVEK